MKYFIFGSGSIGRRHYNNLQVLGADVKILSWKKINLEETLNEIKKLNEGIGVIIATGSDVRTQLIKELTKFDISLYIEKPLAFKKKDIDFIYSLPKKILKKSVVGFMMRYHPIILEMYKLKFDDYFRANFEIGLDVNCWRDNWKFSKSYASNSSGGGVLLDLCHEIDIANLLCGPGKIKNVYSLLSPKFPGVDIASTLIFSNKNNYIYNVSMDYLAPTLLRQGKIIGKKLILEYDIANNLLKIDNGKNKEIKSYDVDRNTLFLSLMKDFMALAEGKKVSNKLIPRLDKVKNVCELIASAWKKREFVGELATKLR